VRSPRVGAVLTEPVNRRVAFWRRAMSWGFGDCVAAFLRTPELERGEAALKRLRTADVGNGERVRGAAMRLKKSI